LELYFDKDSPFDKEVIVKQQAKENKEKSDFENERAEILEKIDSFDNVKVTDKDIKEAATEIKRLVVKEDKDLSKLWGKVDALPILEKQKLLDFVLGHDPSISIWENDDPWEHGPYSWLFLITFDIPGFIQALKMIDKKGKVPIYSKDQSVSLCCSTNRFLEDLSGQ